MSRYDMKPEYEDLGYIHEKDTMKNRCPFCGHVVLHYARRPDRKIVVKCTIHLCGIEGPPRASRKAAFQAWRTRNSRGPVQVGRLA